MNYEMLFNMVIAVLAVFGVCSLIKLTADSLFLRGEQIMAIIYDKDSSPDDILIKINRLKASWHGWSSPRIALMIAEDAQLPDAFIDCMLVQGIELYRALPYDCSGVDT